MMNEIWMIPSHDTKGIRTYRRSVARAGMISKNHAVIADEDRAE